MKKRIHKEALLDVYGGTGSHIHQFALIEKASCVDADVDDGGKLFATAVQVESVYNEEELADGTKNTLDLLAVGGLMRCLDQQFLG